MIYNSNLVISSLLFQAQSLQGIQMHSAFFFFPPQAANKALEFDAALGQAGFTVCLTPLTHLTKRDRAAVILLGVRLFRCAALTCLCQPGPLFSQTGEID